MDETIHILRFFRIHTRNFSNSWIPILDITQELLGYWNSMQALVMFLKSMMQTDWEDIGPLGTDLEELEEHYPSWIMWVHLDPVHRVLVQGSQQKNLKISDIQLLSMYLSIDLSDLPHFCPPKIGWAPKVGVPIYVEDASSGDDRLFHEWKLNKEATRTT